MTILAYLFALPIMLVGTTGASLLSLVALPLFRVFNAHPAARLTTSFLIAFLTTAAGALLFIATCHVLSIVPAWMMFCLPLMAYVGNGLNRVWQAKDGTSNVARWSAQEGIPYDANLHMWSAIFGLLGSVVALAGIASLMTPQKW